MRAYYLDRKAHSGAVAVFGRGCGSICSNIVQILKTPHSSNSVAVVKAQIMLLEEALCVTYVEIGGTIYNISIKSSCISSCVVGKLLCNGDGEACSKSPLNIRLYEL